MSMPLAEWDYKIARHLHGIESGAELCARHAGQLVFQPDFTTLALDELDRAEIVLKHALTQIRKAKQAYQEKPIAT
jgi:hypothetical protein